MLLDHSVSAFVVATFLFILVNGKKMTNQLPSRAAEQSNTTTTSYEPLTSFPRFSTPEDVGKNVAPKSIIIEEKVSKDTIFLPYDETGNCTWTSTPLQCVDGKLNLTDIGCTNRSNETLRQESRITDIKKSSSKSAGAKNCLQLKSTKTPCEVCRLWEEWSEWKLCCGSNRPCYFDEIGSVPGSRKARFRSISKDCRTLFDIPSSCLKEVQISRQCGRRAGGSDPSDNENDKPGALSSFSRIVIFSVAGVVMICLFGFAGLRLVRTMYLHPASSNTNSREPSCATHDQNDNHYINPSFHASHEGARGTSGDPESLQLHPTRLGHRILPPVSRLSVIHEEEDALSTSNQEPDEKSATDASPNVHRNNIKNSPGTEAMKYMDDIITEIEEEQEDDITEDNHDHEIATESKGLLNNYGWNPEARFGDFSKSNVEKLKGTASSERLTASALSLASAELLQAALHSGNTSSAMTLSSSRSSKEDCYSLRDIDYVDSESDSTWKRECLSLPDISKIKDCIPDIDEMLSDNISSCSYESSIR